MNKFDRILWRINGVILLAVLIFGLLPLVWSLSESWLHRPLRLNAPPIVREVQGIHEKEFLHLGWPSRITGTSVLRIPLYGEVPPRGSSSFKGGGERAHTRNYLFVDYSDLSSWWLFEGFDRAILKEHDLRASVEGKDKPVISTIFEVATADTNGDHRITEDDHVVVFFAAADGKKPTQIVSPSDRILSVDQVGNDQALIVYQHGAAVTAALFPFKTARRSKSRPCRSTSDQRCWVEIADGKINWTLVSVR